jgi:hypothetical protein
LSSSSSSSCAPDCTDRLARAMWFFDCFCIRSKISCECVSKSRSRVRSRFISAGTLLVSVTPIEVWMGAHIDAPQEACAHCSPWRKLSRYDTLLPVSSMVGSCEMDTFRGMVEKTLRGHCAERASRAASRLGLGIRIPDPSRALHPASIQAAPVLSRQDTGESFRYQTNTKNVTVWTDQVVAQTSHCVPRSPGAYCTPPDRPDTRPISPRHVVQRTNRS